MTVQQHVLNWLYSVLTSEYQDVNRTYNDVAQSLTRYPSLTPRTDVHTKHDILAYSHGQSALLLHLAGTLPVNFRGSTYRFPLSIWLPHAYPREPPLVYVTPTETMTIRPGQHVDPQGQVYHPYLAGWAEFWDKSTLQDFLTVLAEVFAKEPPAVARQQQPSRASQSSLSVQSGPSVPPHPTGLIAQSLAHQRPPSGHHQPPPPPPKPHQFAQPEQYRHSSISSSHGTNPPPPNVPQRPSRYESAPPLPQEARSSSIPQSPSHSRPPSQTATFSNQYQQRMNQGLPYHQQQAPASRRPPSQGPHHLSTPQVQQHNSSTGMWQQQQQQQQHQWPSPQGQSSAAWQSLPSHSQAQAYRQAQAQATPYAQGPVAALAHSQAPPDLLDEPLTLSIPSQAVAPPPIPPNPERNALLQQLAQTLFAMRQRSRQQNESSMVGLQVQRAAMGNVMPALQSEMGQLTQLSNILASNTQILHEALRKADAVIQGSRDHQAPDIDDLLVAPTVVSNQLYNLVAEEKALGDAIFMLGRAMERGRIKPVVFSKMTRSLAREWYLKKALVRKIGQGMGLMGR